MGYAPLIHGQNPRNVARGGRPTTSAIAEGYRRIQTSPTLDTIPDPYNSPLGRRGFYFEQGQVITPIFADRYERGITELDRQPQIHRMEPWDDRLP